MHPADDKPKHKPNPKHTLEEILKSLQDLIRNDLLEGDTPPPTAGRPVASARVSVPGGELEDLRHSLENLVSEELTTEDTVAIEQPVTDQPAPAAMPIQDAIRAEGLQDVFSSDTAVPALVPQQAPGAPPPEQQAAAAQPAFDASATADSEALLATDDASAAEELTACTPQADLPPLGTPVEAPVGEPVEAADLFAAERPPDASPPESAGDWEDIPVLDEVVTEPPAEPEPGEIPDGASLPPPAVAAGPEAGGPRPPARPDAVDEHTSQTPPDNLELPLPAPSRAHDLAVRTVARLNIELRKAGKRPLDAKLIARLAMTLRETLESEAVKVENKPHE